MPSSLPPEAYILWAPGLILGRLSAEPWLGILGLGIGILLRPWWIAIASAVVSGGLWGAISYFLANALGEPVFEWVYLAVLPVFATAVLGIGIARLARWLDTKRVSAIVGQPDAVDMLGTDATASASQPPPTSGSIPTARENPRRQASMMNLRLDSMNLRIVALSALVLSFFGFFYEASTYYGSGYSLLDWLSPFSYGAFEDYSALSWAAVGAGGGVAVSRAIREPGPASRWWWSACAAVVGVLLGYLFENNSYPQPFSNWLSPASQWGRSYTAPVWICGAGLLGWLLAGFRADFQRAKQR